MPEKSIREMNLIERQHYSLAARTFRATIMGAVIFGLVSLVIGLGLYAYAVGGQYIGEAFNLSKSIGGIIGKVVDVEPLADEVMSRYRGLDDSVRKDPGSDAYAAAFSDIADRDDYKTSLLLLREFLKSSDVYDVYIAAYDWDLARMVYISDPDEEDSCPPGYWESVNPKGMKRFRDWDGEGRLYDIAKTEKYGWLATGGVPLKNDAGETVAFVLADVSLSGMAGRMKDFLLPYTLAMFIVVNLVGIIMALHMRRRLADPINRIAAAAAEYVRDKRSGATDSTHFADLGISTGDEIENLVLTMADMEKDLAGYEADLARVIAERERAGTELELARRIQADMLPNIYPAFPDRPEFDIYASMTPAKEVGGDFYDFFLIDSGHLGIVMADVSGKGIPAALFMMVSKILVQNCAAPGLSPGEVLEAVNDRICANNREDMFVTVWFGILDIGTGVLTAANAGHEYPVLKKPDGDFELLKDRHGFVIGGMSGMKYKDYEIKLLPGSKLFLYTDGVPEASDPDGRPFGNERMLEALKNAEDGTTVEILDAVGGALRAFAGDAPRSDDITMLCLWYTGAQKADRDKAPAYREITLPASIDSIPAATAFVDAELAAAGASERTQTRIDVAVDEIMSNIASYAYGEAGGNVTVRVGIEDEPRAAVISFTDSGRPFDPLAAPAPDVTLSADEREAGGLGIFIVKKTIDCVSYEYKDGKNILTLREPV